MSGYKDSITDQMLMAGSPETLMCLDIDFQVLLGQSGKPIVGFKHLKELCIEHHKHEYLEKISVAEQLVIAAQRMFCYPEGKGTDFKAACEALHILNVK